MAVFTSKQFGGGRPPISPEHAGHIVSQYSEVLVPNTLALNDILRMCRLPANCVPVGVWVHCDAIDTGAVLRCQVALEDPDNLESIIASSELTAAAYPISGAIAHMTSFPAAILQNAAALATERRVVIKITTAGTTKVEGTVRMLLQYRAADFGL